MMAECSVKSFAGSVLKVAELKSRMAWLRVLALRIAAVKFDGEGAVENGNAAMVLEITWDFMRKRVFKF